MPPFVNADASQGCEFPSKFTGTWFQKGVHPAIKIEKDIFSLKGKCLAADSHMFYIEDAPSHTSFSEREDKRRSLGGVEWNVFVKNGLKRDDIE
ncbi:hypothetical protein CDAR_284071 [Caerostris darwini]|uniref:DUF7044 domain-containing protein n=1 Tax=Caerostris darwini TaxID=1538125 RepID=A0AAV4PJ55_9ARAC|nr:hypothetical protein CDAR_284071 [Caerostris darwini]